tara:strand:+ start:1193 stop:1366 length:174 start_codon:yes stop_codon:yes gene_type:complete
MNIFSYLWDKITNTERVKVRNRTKSGRFVADDKSTPNVNEAYKTVRKKKSTKQVKKT